MASLVEGFSRAHEVHVFARSFRDVRADGVTFHRVRAIESPHIAKVLTFLLDGGRRLAGRAFDIVHTIGLTVPRQDVTTAPLCQAARWRAMARYDVRPGFFRRLYHPAYYWATAGLEQRMVYADGRVRRVVAISRKVKEELAGLYGFPGERIDVIHCGVDLEAFRPLPAQRRALREALDLTEEDSAVLYVGTPGKGWRTALRALARRADSRVKLVAKVSGKFSGAEDLLVDPRLRARVRTVGHVPDLAALYNACDLLIHPSLYDGFGLVPLEAMACGLPAVVSREAGVSEILSDGVDSLLLSDATDDAELAAAITRLAEDRGFCAEVGRRARATAEAYPWQRMVDAVGRVYQAVLEGRGRA